MSRRSSARSRRVLRPRLGRGPAETAVAAAAVSKDDGPRTSARDLIDATRLTEFIGWLAVAGSALAAVGFLLPWAMSVIGATGIDYLDRWGLAGPFHPSSWLGVLAVLGAALVPNRVPLWVRVGLPGLGLGALLLGLVWPYLLVPARHGSRRVVVALGAVILLAAGIVALVATVTAPEIEPSEPGGPRLSPRRGSAGTPATLPRNVDLTASVLRADTQQ